MSADAEKKCRICIETTSPETMLSPCNCSGSMKYVHRECLVKWVNHSHNTADCDVCQSHYSCRFVAARRDIWQVFKFFRDNINVFALLMFVSLHFVVGLVSSVLGLGMQMRRGYRCYKTVAEVILAVMITLCLIGTLAANIFWYFMFCTLTAELVVDAWRKTIVYTIEE